MTKLLNSCEENLGIHLLQSVAISRLIGLQRIVFLQILQIVLARDTSCYYTLNGYYHMASNRYSFPKCLAVLVHFLQDKLFALLTPLECPLSPPTNVLLVTPTQRRNIRHTHEEMVLWNVQLKSGNIPKLGQQAKADNLKMLAAEAWSNTCLSLVPLAMRDRNFISSACILKKYFFDSSQSSSPTCMHSRARVLLIVDTTMPLLTSISKSYYCWLDGTGFPPLSSSYTNSKKKK